MIYVGKREDVVEEVDKGRRGSRWRKETAASRSAEAAAGDRSTGPVDRRAQHAQGISGRPVQSTAEGDRSTRRSTD